MLAAIADGESSDQRLFAGADCAATLGLPPAPRRDDPTTGPASMTIFGRGVGGLQPPAGPLDAVNSGTTMRLLSGIVAAIRFGP